MDFIAFNFFCSCHLVRSGWELVDLVALTKIFFWVFEIFVAPFSPRVAPHAHHPPCSRRRPQTTRLDVAERAVRDVAALHIRAAVRASAIEDLDDELLDRADDRHLVDLAVCAPEVSFSRSLLEILVHRHFNFFASLDLLTSL